MHSELCGGSGGQVAVKVLKVVLPVALCVNCGSSMPVGYNCHGNAICLLYTVLARQWSGSHWQCSNAMVMSYLASADHGLAFQPDCQSNFDKPSEYCQNLQLKHGN